MNGGFRSFLSAQRVFAFYRTFFKPFILPFSILFLFFPVTAQTNFCLTSIVAREKQTSITLTWLHDGSTIYNIFRSTSGSNNGFSKIGTSSSTYSTYTDNTVSVDRMYYYRIENANSCTSPVVCAMPRVRARNSAPTVTSIPITGIMEYRNYEYRVLASDPDGNPLNFYLDVCPQGMTIDQSGIIRWLPTQSNVGTSWVGIRVTDGYLCAVQYFQVNVLIDNEPPVVTITSPLNGLFTNHTPIAIAWTIDGVAQTTQLTQALTEGHNTITRSSTDAAGNVGTTSIAVTLDTHAPMVQITSPSNESFVDHSPISIVWSIDGSSQTNQLSENLSEGSNTITRIAIDQAGNTGTASVTVTLNSNVPVVAITAPADNSLTNKTPVHVVWTVDGITQTSQLDETLIEGLNVITRTFTNNAGKPGSASVRVTLDTQAPVVQIVSPVDGAVVDHTPIQISWSIDGILQTVQTNAILNDGENLIIRTSTDASGNIGTDTNRITYQSKLPCVQINTPSAGTISTTTTVGFSAGLVTYGATMVSLLIDGVEHISDFSTAGTARTGTLTIPNGHHSFWAIARNANNRLDTARTYFNVNTIPTQTQIAINGKVIDGKTMQGLSGASVTVQENGNTAITDADGNFTLQSGGFADYTIRISHSSYTAASRPIRADQGIDIKLSPIIIMPLNPQTVTVPASVASTVTIPGSEVQLSFPENAVSRAINVTATVYNQIEQLPNEQPGEDVFLFSVDLQPHGATFAKPVTVRIPNERSLTAGAPVPITYFNETSGLWEDVGNGVVTADGKFLEFQTTHFSCFHGNWHQCLECLKKLLSSLMSTISGSSCKGDQTKISSSIPIRTGELENDFVIPGGPGFSDLSVGLRYWSSTASPRMMLSSRFDNLPTAPSYINWKLYMPGLEKQWLFYGPTKPSGITYIWNCTDSKDSLLPTGLYPYGIRVSDVMMPGRYQYSFGQAENLFVNYTTPTVMKNYYYDFATVVNRRNSPYGAGWAIDGVTRIVGRKSDLPAVFPRTVAYRGIDQAQRTTNFGGSTPNSAVAVSTAIGSVKGTPDGNHVMLIGAGTTGTIYWQHSGSTLYEPPYGGHDTLYATNPGWIRKLADGTIESYNDAGVITRRVSPKGFATRYEWDTFNERVLRIVDEKTGRATEIIYGFDNKLEGIRDQFGRVTTIAIDANGDLAEIHTPDGTTARRFGYDAQHKMLHKSYAGGEGSVYTYDKWGGITQAVNSDSLISTYERSTDSSIINELEPVSSDAVEGFIKNNTGSIADFSTQPIHRLPDCSRAEYSFTDQYSNKETHTYNSFGMLAAVTNANGDKTSYGYAMGSCCGQSDTTEYPNGVIVTSETDARGNVVRTHNSATGAVTSYTYTTIRSIDYVATVTNAVGQVTRFSYDINGNLTRIIAPGNDTTSMTFNTLQLPESITDPLGRTVHMEYDSLGRVVRKLDAKNHPTSYDYDTMGNLVRIIGSDGKTTWYEYDIVGRLLKEHDPVGNTTRYVYNSEGRLDSLIDPKNHATIFNYDIKGRLASITNNRGIARHYEYDAYGNLTKWTNARGQAVSYQYDELQRLTAKLGPTGEMLGRYAYDLMGNTVFAASPQYAINRVFDNASRMIQEAVFSVTQYDTIRVSDTIPENDLTYDYKHLVIDGQTVILDGEHNFLSLTLRNNAVIKHLPTTGKQVHSMKIFARDSIRIEAGSSIDVTGLGYLGGRRNDNTVTFGRADGNTTGEGSGPGAGGSHGGSGGPYRYNLAAWGGGIDTVNRAGRTYDDRLWPVQPGAGGGSNGQPAFNGGGVVQLNAPRVILNGQIVANGENAVNKNGGAGAGGSVIIETDTLLGNGIVRTEGGNGLQSGNGFQGGGGGGRVYIAANYFGAVGYMLNGGTFGGAIGTSAFRDGNGVVFSDTILPKGTTTTIGKYDESLDGQVLIIDSSTVIINGRHSFKSIVLRNSAVITHDSPVDSSDVGIMLNVEKEITIDSTSKIDVTGKGYAGGTRYTSAQTVNFKCGSTGYGGGSYGGLGGEVNGFVAPTYGSAILPGDFGSGGSSGITENSILVPIEPANDTTIEPIDVTLRWQTGNYTDYSIILDTIPDPVNFVANHVKNNCFYIGLHLKPLKRYYWKVVGYNGADVAFSSHVSSFLTGTVALIAGNNSFEDTFESNVPKYWDIRTGVASDLRPSILWQAPGVHPCMSNIALSQSRYFEGTTSLSVFLRNCIGCSCNDNRTRHSTIILTPDSAMSVVVLKDTLSLYMSAVTYTTSSRYDWQTWFAIADDNDTVFQLLRGKCWSNNYDCPGINNDSYAQLITGADGQQWYKYSIPVPSHLEKSKLKIYLIHEQDSWDNTTAESRFFVDHFDGFALSPHPVNLNVQQTIEGAATGGGRIQVTATALHIDGKIEASGSNALYGAAGSGGSILLNIGTISGTGKITSNGGFSTRYGGGGGGGRVSIPTCKNINISLPNIRAYGGAGSVPGHCGTVYLGNADTLIRKEYDPLNPDTITLANKIITISSGDVQYERAFLNVTNSSIIINGRHEFAGISLNNASIECDSQIVVLKNVYLNNHSVFTHASTGLVVIPSVNLIVDGMLSIDSTSSIDVSGKGYPTGYTMGGAALSYSAGGSHGGSGGYNSGQTYDNYRKPSFPGSGGGYPGFADPAVNAGGGVIRIDARHIQINGKIIADGVGTSNSGAGGSIWLNADTISGSGAVRANGGGSSEWWNGGGGGRIALYAAYASGTCIDNVNVSGMGNGSIYLDIGSIGKELRFVDYSEIPCHIPAFTDSLSRVLVTNGGKVQFDGNVYASIFQVDNSTAILTDSLFADSVRIGYNGVLTHAMCRPDTVYGVKIFAKNVWIHEYGTIDVTGKGYPVGYTAGGIAWTDCSSGGSHGGIGQGNSSLAYDNFREPILPGSGAGSPDCGDDGTGGGLVRILAQVINSDGMIVAGGGRDNYGYSPAGAGGSVWLTADSITGKGYVSANSSDGYTYGAGGRISLQALSISDVIKQNLTAAGYSAGTICISDISGNKGVLLLNNQRNYTPDSSTYITSIGTGRISQLTCDTLTCDTCHFPAFHKTMSGLSGLTIEINPTTTHDSEKYYKILWNDTTRIVVDTSGGRSLLLKAAPGDSFSGIILLDTLKIKGKAKGFSKDPILFDVIDTVDTVSMGLYYNKQDPSKTNLARKGAKRPQASRIAISNKGRSARECVMDVLNKAWKVAAGKSDKFSRRTSSFSAQYACVKPSVAADSKLKPVAFSLQVAGNQLGRLSSIQQSRHDEAYLFVSRYKSEPAAVSSPTSETTTQVACAGLDPLYTYDILGRRTSMTDPTGTTHYEYDSITGNLSALVDPNGKRFEFAYNKGQLQSMVYPNSISANYTFDNNGNLTALDYVNGAANVAQFHYGYDDNNMRTSMTDNDGVHNYGYDQLYQIISATNPTAPRPLEQFTYDSVGNRLTVDGSAFVWQYDDLNRLMEDDKYRYDFDADGNMVLKVDKTTNDSTMYSYNVENKMVKVEKRDTVVEFVYDAIGRRMSKVVNGMAKQYRYDGEDLILELNNNDSIVAKYTFGPGIDRPLKMVRNGNEYYDIADGLGSITALTDASGNVVQQYKYSVFGEIIDKSGSVENSFTYTAREWDGEIGLYYYRARFFDARVGRFGAEDPLGFITGINMYKYANNEPVDFSDAKGLETAKNNLENFKKYINSNGTRSYDLVYVHGIHGDYCDASKKMKDAGLHPDMIIAPYGKDGGVLDVIAADMFTGSATSEANWYYLKDSYIKHVIVFSGGAAAFLAAAQKFNISYGELSSYGATNGTGGGTVIGGTISHGVPIDLVVATVHPRMVTYGTKEAKKSLFGWKLIFEW